MGYLPITERTDGVVFGFLWLVHGGLLLAGEADSLSAFRYRYTGYIVKAMKQDIFAGGNIQVDETPIAELTSHNWAEGRREDDWSR